MSSSATNEFVEAHRPLVRSIAKKVKVQLALQCELDDLLGFGMQGLLEAQARYDSSRGVQFSTFAYYRIRGAIVDGVRQMAYVPRRMHARMKALEAADRVAEDTGETWVANHAQREDAALAARTIESTLVRITHAWLLAGAAIEEEPSTTTGPETSFFEEEQSAKVREAVERLPEREAALVRGFYFEGRQFDDVANDLGISKSWASRLHTKALDLLREKLREVET